jgi:predicted PurR-regulated permease PerM
MTLVELFPGLRGAARLSERALVTAGHLLGHRGERVARKIADAMRATVSGTVAAAIANGAVIGVAEVLTGVPHPLLFTVLTMALAMVPFGAWAALAAAVLILLVHGGTWLPVLPATTRRHC